MVLYELAKLSVHGRQIIAVYGFILIGGVNLDPNFQTFAEVMLHACKLSCFSQVVYQMPCVRM